MGRDPAGRGDRRMGLVGQGDVWWVDLDPTFGTEINKTLPALVVLARRHERETAAGYRKRLLPARDRPSAAFLMLILAFVQWILWEARSSKGNRFLAGSGAQRVDEGQAVPLFAVLEAKGLGVHASSTLEEPAQLIVAHLRDPRLAGGERQIDELALVPEHGVDSLLETARGDEAVHEDVLGLADAEGAIGGLVLDRRIEPKVVVDDP